MGPIRTAGAVPRNSSRTKASLAMPVAIALTVLAGCSSAPEDQATYVCPAVTIVRDLSLVTRFDGAADPGGQLFSGEIVGAAGECSYDDGAVEVAVQVSMVYDRPQGLSALAEPITFFVAVGRPDGSVIGKETFASTAEFRDTESRAGFREEVSVTVPLPEGPASASGYTVFVGFQLTADELEFNRQRRQ